MNKTAMVWFGWTRMVPCFGPATSQLGERCHEPWQNTTVSSAWERFGALGRSSRGSYSSSSQMISVPQRHLKGSQCDAATANYVHKLCMQRAIFLYHLASECPVFKGTQGFYWSYLCLLTTSSFFTRGESRIAIKLLLYTRPLDERSTVSSSARFLAR